MDNQDPVFAVNAAKYFIEKHPRYIVCPENSKILTAEIVRLVNEGADPSAVSTYDQAFAGCWEELQLEPEEPPKAPEELTMEEIAALSPAQQDRLPSPVLRKFANWELQNQNKKPQLQPEVEWIKKLFEDNGFAFSLKNINATRTFLQEKGLAFTEEHFLHAMDALETELEPSDAEISAMSSEEYKKIVDKELREWQAKQPKPEPSRVPLGVKSYSSWLHER